MKSSFKQEAVDMRRKGFSYSFILEKIPVSKSTLSFWLSGVDYKPNSKVLARIGKARAASGVVKASQRTKTITDASVSARAELGVLNRRDLFMLGLGIYIGEGTKSHNIIRITNSDSGIIRFMIRWFHVVCKVPKKNFRIRLHLYPDINVHEALKYWSKETKIPIEQFHPPSIDNRQNKKMVKRGKLPYGTAHLGVNSSGDSSLGTFLFHKINSWVRDVTKMRV
ncbi:MAG TPA: hypothetical protein VJJ22_03080 [Candidatus Paceibacterota bacterium]